MGTLPLVKSGAWVTIIAPKGLLCRRVQKSMFVCPWVRPMSQIVHHRFRDIGRTVTTCEGTHMSTFFSINFFLSKIFWSKFFVTSKSDTLQTPWLQHRHRLTPWPGGPGGKMLAFRWFMNYSRWRVLVTSWLSYTMVPEGPPCPAGVI